MKKYNKDVIDTTVSNTILPIGMGAIRHEGQLGRATSTIMATGHAKKTAKKFGLF